MSDNVIRELRDDDWDAVRRVYAEGIATGNATFETEVPSPELLDAKWLRGHRWVAEIDGEVAGWAAAAPVSARECYAGLAETSVYVGAGFRGRGVGRALLRGHRWVAEIDGEVAGWAAAAPVSARECYAGLAETSVYVGAGFRGRGVGRALLREQTGAADAGGLWTLQTSIFPENEASIALHRAAGFREVGTRERIARHHGVWRDTVLLERRRAD